LHWPARDETFMLGSHQELALEWQLNTKGFAPFGNIDHAQAVRRHVERPRGNYLTVEADQLRSERGIDPAIGVDPIVMYP
jgi:hypothetical protein